MLVRTLTAPLMLRMRATGGLDGRKKFWAKSRVGCLLAQPFITIHDATGKAPRNSYNGTAMGCKCTGASSTRVSCVHAGAATEAVLSRVLQFVGSCHHVSVLGEKTERIAEALGLRKPCPQFAAGGPWQLQCGTC